MKFKILMLMASCLAMLLKPAHSDDSSSLTEGALNTARGIATIVPDMLKAKATAVARAAADMASIVTMGTGLEVKALGTAASAMKGAVSDGLYALGDTFVKAGNTITGGYPNYNNENAVRSPDVREVVADNVAPCSLRPCDQVVRVKVHPSTYEQHGRTVWKEVKNVNAESSVHGRGKFVKIRRRVARRPHLVYEIINTPREYIEPRSIRIAKNEPMLSVNKL